MKIPCMQRDRSILFQKLLFDEDGLFYYFCTIVSHPYYRAIIKLPNKEYI